MAADSTDPRYKAAVMAWEFDNRSSEFLETEFETYDYLREHMPLARSKIGSGAIQAVGSATDGGWVLTRYDDLVKVVSDTENFSSELKGYPGRRMIP